jgi:hypothetical protein
MASTDIKSLSTSELFNLQLNELKQMKIDLEKQKHEFIAAQTKYHQQLSNYETKFEQLHSQARKIQQEQDEKESHLLSATAEWRDMKNKLESSAVSSSQKVKLNIGGKLFETTIGTLTQHSEGTTSYFKALFSRQWPVKKDSKDDTIFIDRDAGLFNYILQYLRTGQLIIDGNDSTLRRNLYIEAQFYKIPNLISLFKTNATPPQNHNHEQKILYADTKILSYEQQEHLNKLYGSNNQQWQLIYRASRDGFTAKRFHQFCDGYGPTMTVIRSQNGCIFGGYTSIPWSSSDQDKRDGNAFLFTLTNLYTIKPTKYPILERSTSFAVSHKRLTGPSFGSINNGGSDIYLQSPFNTGDSGVHFPASYRDTTGKGRITFTGEPHFSCEDVEIFLLVSQ